MKTPLFRPARGADALSISVLLATAFEGPAESQLVQSLRKSDEIALELVAEVDGDVVGYIAFVRLTAPAGWAALAPMAVRTNWRGRGIGGELVRIGLDQLRQQNVPAVIVLGPVDFYERFGFSQKAAADLSSVYDGRFLMLYAIDPHTAGTRAPVVYPKAFDGL